jgi:hypothetical protein
VRSLRPWHGQARPDSPASRCSLYWLSTIPRLASPSSLPSRIVKDSHQLRGTIMQWDEVEQFMIAEAERDLEAGNEVRPCFAAFACEAPLVLAFLRPFPKGGYHDPLIELLALAAPLNADRLKLSLSGRAWSMDDPIPPVDPDFATCASASWRLSLSMATPAGCSLLARCSPSTSSMARSDGARRSAWAAARVGSPARWGSRSVSVTSSVRPPTRSASRLSGASCSVTLLL